MSGSTPNEVKARRCIRIAERKLGLTHEGWADNRKLTREVEDEALRLMYLSEEELSALESQGGG